MSRRTYEYCFHKSILHLVFQKAQADKQLGVARKLSGGTNGEDVTNRKYVCTVCQAIFNDSLAAMQHQITEGHRIVREDSKE